MRITNKNYQNCQCKRQLFIQFASIFAETTMPIDKSNYMPTENNNYRIKNNHTKN